MSTYSKYPNKIDTNSELPISTDNVTPVKAEVVNRLRDAILSIETELGPDPSSTFSSVKDRIDSLEQNVSAISSESFDQIKFILSGATDNVSFNNQQLKAVGEPTDGSDVTTKNYVDGALSNVSVIAKSPVTDVSDGAIGFAYTFANNTITGNSNLNIGVPAGTEILFVGEIGAKAPYNGIYVVTDPGSVTTPPILTRRSDVDTSEKVKYGIFTLALHSSPKEFWMLTTPDPIVLNTTPLTWTVITKLYEFGSGFTTTDGITYDIKLNDTSLSVSGSGLKVNLNNDSLEVSSGLRVHLNADSSISNSSGLKVHLNGDGSLISSSGLGVNPSGDGSITVAGGVSVGTINDTQHGNRGGGSLHNLAGGVSAGFIDATSYALITSSASTSVVGTLAKRDSSSGSSFGYVGITATAVHTDGATLEPDTSGSGGMQIKLPYSDKFVFEAGAAGGPTTKSVINATAFVHTTDATQTVLYSYVMPTNSTAFVTATINCDADTSTDAAGYVRSTVVKNRAGVVSLVGTVSVIGTDLEDAGLVANDVTIDTSSTVFRVLVTGQIGITLEWFAKIEIIMQVR